jgi:hypothetical protein
MDSIVGGAVLRAHGSRSQSRGTSALTLQPSGKARATSRPCLDMGCRHGTRDYRAPNERSSGRLCWWGITPYSVRGTYMRATHSTKIGRKIAKSLVYFFIPTSFQLRMMLLVAGLSMVFLVVVVVAWRPGVFVHAYRAITGGPVVVKYEAWNAVPCPDPYNPNDPCMKYTATTQPGFFPSPTP